MSVDKLLILGVDINITILITCLDVFITFFLECLLFILDILFFSETKQLHKVQQNALSDCYRLLK